MEKEYYTTRKTVIDALDDIDLFITSIEKIILKRPDVQYSYDINIKPIDEGEDKWAIDLKLKKDEAIN